MNFQRLAGRVACITGSSSGLGRAIALRFASEGAKIICSDLRTSAREQVPEERVVDTHDSIERNGGHCIFVRADAEDSEQMRNLVEEGVKWGGRLDIMVNNAGISLESTNAAPIHLTTEEVWDTTMRVNAKSVFLGCKYATAQMLKQEALPSDDRGWIINISSIFGLVGGDRLPSYAAAKGAVSNLTRQVALDYAEHRIRCNAICPGFTQTAIFAETTRNYTTFEKSRELHPLMGPGVPDDIAKFAVSLASEDAAWLTGAVVPVDGGYTAR